MSNWRTIVRNPKNLGAIRSTLRGGGRAALRFGSGRTNLLEELGRVEGEHSNRNRRDESYGKWGKRKAKFGRKNKVDKG